ncbi:MAG: aminotransferase class I/II-fold pyridoxal phosphate-dependent enzyme [Candidatus Aminicenantes bacterium]
MYLMESAPGPRTVINGRQMDYFCGCSYYGLHGHPEIIQAACEAAQKYGIGSATSRSGYGNNPILLKVEQLASKFFHTESALYYVSGYLGNSILLQGLEERYDIILMDEESHYSAMDGAALVNKPVIPFGHLDAEDLRGKLKQHLKPSQRPLLICDGIFPVSGEISPLPRYTDVLGEFEGALICVDDAHAIGVIGEKGRGSFEYFGLKGEALYFSGTLSKALGGHGGIIPNRREFIQKLEQKSSIPFSSSAAPTPAAAATSKALEILSKNPGMRKKLWANVAYAKTGLRSLGLEVNDTPVPIICLHSLPGVDLRALQQDLFDKGLAVLYVAGGMYSSVPETGAIRIAIFSSHSRGQIQHLIEEIRKYL